jgi:hypothetical protein
MSKKQLLIGVSILCIILLGFWGYSQFNNNSDDDGFSFNNVVIKTQLIENQTLDTSLKITNLLNERLFEISAKNLDSVMELEQSSLMIPSGESKELGIKFIGIKSGIHSGSILVSTDSGSKEVPVIVSVSTKNPLFFTIIDANTASKDIAPGSKSNINVKLYNVLDKTSHAVKLTYIIKDLAGNTISEETENSVVGGSETSFTKTISIPSDLEFGNYVYGIVTEYGNSVSTSSYLFNVADENSVLSKFDVNSFTILFSIVVLVFLFGIIVLFIVMIRERDKLFVDLRTQHNDELKFYTKVIERKSTVSVAKAKTTEEKKKIVEKYKQIKDKAIESLKLKHEAQIKRFKALRKAKKNNEVEKQIKEWKNQGYQVQELTGLAKSDKDDIASLIKEWKKQGYDTAVIGK